MKYSIIIPTYNHCDDLLRPCLESIFRHTNMDDVELIVSANGCVDNTKEYLEWIKSQFAAIGFEHHFKYIWNDKPLGYAGANNVAIKEACGEKIILLNNDVILLDQKKNRWIEMLDRPFLENQDMGIVGPLLQHSVEAGHDFCVFFCAMIHRNVFNKIGLLNEEYGVGSGEDIEFCIQAARAGFKMAETSPKHSVSASMYSGEFPIYHAGEGTVHDASLVQNWASIFKENQLKLAKKFNPNWHENHVKSLKDKEIRESLKWLCENGPEAQELYDEVVSGNVYFAFEDSMKDRAVIDIGANMGTFSVLAASFGASKVVAVEPVSTTFDLMLKNIKRAGADGVVVAKKAVVMDEPNKTVKIGIQQKTGHNSLYGPQDNCEEVSSVTLKDLLDTVGGNNVFLKMDCEGAEYDILLNADPQDMKRVTTVAMEIHGDLHPKYRGVELIQDKLSFFGFSLIDRKNIGAWDLDQNGNMINYRDLGRTNEIWARK